MSIHQALSQEPRSNKGSARGFLWLVTFSVAILIVAAVGVPLYTNWTTPHEFTFVEKKARAEFKKCVSDVLSDNGVISFDLRGGLNEMYVVLHHRDVTKIFDPRHENRITQISLGENRWARVQYDQGEEIGQPDRTIMTGLTNCYALTLAAAEHPEG